MKEISWIWEKDFHEPLPEGRSKHLVKEQEKGLVLEELLMVALCKDCREADLGCFDQQQIHLNLIIIHWQNIFFQESELSLMDRIVEAKYVYCKDLSL